MVVILLWSRMSVLRLVNFSSCSTLLITQTTIVRTRQTKKFVEKRQQSVQVFILLDGVEGEVDLDDCAPIGLRDFFGLAQVAIFFFAQDEFRR